MADQVPQMMLQVRFRIEKNSSQQQLIYWLTGFIPHFFEDLFRYFPVRLRYLPLQIMVESGYPPGGSPWHWWGAGCSRSPGDPVTYQWSKLLPEDWGYKKHKLEYHLYNWETYGHIFWIIQGITMDIFMGSKLLMGKIHGCLTRWLPIGDWTDEAFSGRVITVVSWNHSYGSYKPT